MTINLEELLAHSYVLTVSQHRLKHFNRTFQKYGLMPLPKPYRGRIVDRRSREYSINRHFVAAHMSHFEICELARRDGWPYVCIFEEDAAPCKNIGNELTEHLVDIPEDALICKLGYVPCSGEQLSLPCTGKWERITDEKFGRFFLGGSHAYIIFSRFYEYNSQMLRLYKDELEGLKDSTILHKPSCPRTTGMNHDWWFYEWLMTPNQFRHKFQERIYCVETCCNLFVQPEYLKWDRQIKNVFDSSYGPSFVRRLMRVLVSYFPSFYNVWSRMRNCLGMYSGSDTSCRSRNEASN